MGEQQLRKVLDEFGEVVIQTMADQAGHEGDALEQTLDVGVACAIRAQERRQRGVARGEFSRKRAQIAQFLFVVAVQHALLPSQ
ncbi:hypothetical protein D3C72_1161690 [compost metagenome]